MAIITVIAAFLFPIFDSALSGGSNWVELTVGLSYPILDAILLTLVIMTIINIHPGTGKYQSIPSLMILIAMVAFVIADTGFGYDAVIDLEQLQEHDRIWNSLYNLGYLSIAGALFWEYRLRRS